MTFPPKVWNGVLQRLRAEVPPSPYEAWLAPVIASVGEADDEQELRLRCRDAFHVDRIRKLFLPRIVELVDEVNLAQGAEVRVELEVCDSLHTSPPEHLADPSDRPSERTLDAEEPKSRGPMKAQRSAKPVEVPPVQHVLPGMYTFDNFVVGPCNALAREAAMALVRGEQRSLQQLYLASATGLGKTHLSRAVAAAGRRVLYVSAEGFTNEFMSSVRGGGMERFKRRYRNDCELLVVDDIQFFEGKRSTQLELFHTLQHLLDTGRRVLLTGDRPPRDLGGLSQQIQSQLGSSFVAELEPPDATIRRSILRSKAASGGVPLPEDCLELLVDAVRGSVRDLEGMLIQLVTTASLLKRKIDADLTRDTVAKRMERVDRSHDRGASAPRLEVDQVIRVVARFFKTTPASLASRSRRRDILVPRQLAMYFCQRYTDASLAEVGRCFGRRHPSVRNSIEVVERSILERAPLRYQVEAVGEKLDELLRPDR